MLLPDDLHKRLAEEYRFAADKMSESKDPQRQLYFFSVFFGEAVRLLNWTWDRDLVLLHNTLRDTHQQINGRLQSISIGGETVVRIQSDLMDALNQAANELATHVENKGSSQELHDLLGRFAELSYISTGNGSYLFEKGHIKL